MPEDDGVLLQLLDSLKSIAVNVDENIGADVVKPGPQLVNSSLTQGEVSQECRRFSNYLDNPGYQEYGWA